MGWPLFDRPIRKNNDTTLQLAGGNQGSLFNELPRKFRPCELDDTTSECSTVSGYKDEDVRDDDCLSASCSDSGLEVNSLLIFDWDDTLFPTSWIHKHGLLVKGVAQNADQQTQLDKMAEGVRSTLQVAMQIGTVVIVTNAEQGWIEMSCTKFMPSLVSLLKSVDLVSARTTYGNSVREPAEWKRLAFEYEVDLFYGSKDAGQQRNIVSVGDSLHELLALKSVTSGMRHCLGKSIKLLEAPSIAQLIEEHDVLTTCLFDVVQQADDLDIEIGAEHLE